MADNNSSLILETALKKIPELYQPIFGHPEYDGKTSRICTDRLKYIRKVYDALSKKLNRPLNVLEFGCNSGFMSLTMASWGAKVVALDADRSQMDVWRILVNENPKLDVSFVLARIEQFINEVVTGKYDLVLGLSVFHHLCNLHGFRSVEKMLTVLSRKVTAGIFELALRTEPANWARALPEDYRDFLSGFSCVKLLAYNKSYFSTEKRPLVFASNEYVYFEKIGMLKINPEDYPEDYVPQFQRRYFFCEDKFVKGARIFLSRDPQRHFEEFQRESQFLQKWGGVSDFPKLCTSDIYESEIEREIWIAREKIEGTPLSVFVQNHSDFDGKGIIKQIAKQLVFLEELGYHHQDLRLLNFLYNERQGKVILIDHGALCEKTRDFEAVRNAVYNFFSLIVQILERQPDKDLATFETIRGAIDLKKYLTQEQYIRLLSIRVDAAKIFSELYDILFLSEETDLPKAAYTIKDYEILSLERLVEGARNDRQQNYFHFSSLFSYHAQVINQMTDSINALNRAVAQQQEQIAALEKKLSKLESN